MRLKKKIVLGFLFLFLHTSLYAYTFKYSTQKDTTYRLFSASMQNLKQNRGITNTVVFEQAYEALLRVTDLDEANEPIFSGEYRYSERPFLSKEAYKITGNRVYKSHFTRSPLGKVKALSKEDYYPVIRSVPLFPAKDLQVGSVWSNEGVEVQDFSLIGYKKPFYVPFKAHYQYIGDVVFDKKGYVKEIESYKKYFFQIESQKRILEQKSRIQKGVSLKNGEKSFAIISVIYDVNYKEEDHLDQTQQVKQAKAVPVKNAIGEYKGIIFWDKTLGEESLSLGEYNFTYSWDNGDIRHWTGKEYGVVDVLKKDKKQVDKLEKNVEEKLDKDKNIEVEKQKDGIKLILGDLLFEFNKTRLRAPVIKSLQKINDILKSHPKTFIRIKGFSDDLGTKAVKQKISEGRSKAVADFLISHGIDANRILYSGEGDKNPRVPNTNSVNRKKNRRVELTIFTH